jgi:hypothetical protein
MIVGTEIKFLMIKKIIGGIIVLALVLALVSAVNKVKGAKGASNNLKEAAQINFNRPGFGLIGIDSKSYSTDQVKNPWSSIFGLHGVVPVEVRHPNWLS